MNNLINKIVFLLLATFLSMVITCYAEGEKVEGDSQAFNIKTQLSYIAMAGIGGAVLGLSTLSFSAQPHRHLRNIAYFSASSVIIAVIYVTYASTATTKENYQKSQPNRKRESLNIPLSDNVLIDLKDGQLTVKPAIPDVVLLDDSQSKTNVQVKMDLFRMQF